MVKEKSEHPGNGFWSTGRIILATCLVFVFLFGALVEHYYIEPSISQGCVEELRICKIQGQALGEESRECYQKADDLNRLLADCGRDLQRYKETVV